MTDFLTLQQAARRLRICQRTLLEHVKARELDATHVGRGRLRRRLRFDPADLEAFNERTARANRGTKPMSVYKHEKSSFYHFDFQYKGRRFHGSTRETALAAAKRIEADERQKAIARDGDRGARNREGQSPDRSNYTDHYRR